MRREIHISYALNGYWCKVGCQLVVFEKRNELLCALSDYLQNPEATEARFRKEAVNPMEEDLCQPNPLYTNRPPAPPEPEPMPMPPPTSPGGLVGLEEAVRNDFGIATAVRDDCVRATQTLRGCKPTP